MFVFAGRRPNIELQLPFIHRILEQHPEVEYHLWNQARNPTDNQYLRTISGDRITVKNDFYNPNDPTLHFNNIYRHYTDGAYRDCLFVKLDDDIVFIETGRFEQFVAAIPGDAVLSAKTVNNGACTPTEPGLHAGFKKLRIPLLDVHQHFPFAEMCHNYFFDHWPTMINQPTQLIPTDGWLSINLIGYTWQLGRQFTPLLRTPSPSHIAGRNFPPQARLGDEGLINTLPRFIFQGMTACHLSFGPQLANAGEAPFTKMRQRYAEIGQKYLTC